MMNSDNFSSILQRLFVAFLLLLALPWAHAATEVVTYYHNDALGSPVAATNSSGQVVWRESYQPYGKRQSGSVTANEQWFTGKQEESVLGLQYFGARWYDQNTGRFVSMDPVGFQEGKLQSFNRYAYANNNPYKYVDPDGNSPVDVVFLAVDVGTLAFHLATGNTAGAASSAVDVAFSTIGLFSPVPGTGQALKFAKVADRVGDGARSADIKVIGRLEDTKVARDWEGHDVLNIPDWTIKKNDEWVQQGIRNKQEFYTGSPEKGNLWDVAANRETVYGRELRQIKEAGYVKQGDSYIHPDNM